MNDLFRTILQKFISLLLWIGNKLSKKFPYEFLNAVCTESDKKMPYYFSYTLKPSTADQVYKDQLCKDTFSNTAIIMQGPVLEENDFTIETIKIYKKFFPHASIIVSTWDNTNPKIKDVIKNLGVYYVESTQPIKTGIGNINYQTISTNKGIEVAEGLGMEYILKTRTDQRLANPFLLEYFFSLLTSFDVGDDYSYLGQEKRIIVAQGTKTKGAMFIPFFISDFFFFGTIKDIKRYFDFDLQDIQLTRDEKDSLAKKLKKECSVAEYNRRLAPEVIYARNYVSKKNTIDVPNTNQKSWSFIKSNLICVSFDEVQFFWPKYYGVKMENNLTLSFLPEDSFEKKLSYSWTFSNWLSLYTGQINYSDDIEKIAMRHML